MESSYHGRRFDGQHWWDLWAYQHDVTPDFSRPCKPTDNAFIEAFKTTRC